METWRMYDMAMATQKYVYTFYIYYQRQKYHNHKLYHVDWSIFHGDNGNDKRVAMDSKAYKYCCDCIDSGAERIQIVNINKNNNGARTK